jgi:ketosteroid isomerase-like protein
VARRDDSPERIFRAAFAEARELTPGSLDEWLALGERWWTEDIEMTEDPRFPGAGTFRGRRELAERFAEYTETVLEPGFDIEEIETVGDVFVLRLRLTGRGRASGVSLEQRWNWVVRLVDGRVALIQPFLDVAEARAAADIASA